MLISTKGRYALRFMLDLAEHQGAGYLSLKTVAERQKISMKYLEAIAGSLQSKKLVQSTRGKMGGYRLADSPEKLKVASILLASQGALNTVDCNNGSGCHCTQGCLTRGLWQDLNNLILGFFESLSLQNLLDAEKKEEKELYLLQNNVIKEENLQIEDIQSINTKN